MCAITAVCIETKNRVENGNTKNIRLGRWREDWEVSDQEKMRKCKEQNIRLTEVNTRRIHWVRVTGLDRLGSTNDSQPGITRPLG